MISIIIPVYNEEAVLARCFQSLASWQARGCEVIVVDGGSTDGSVRVSEKYADRVLRSVKGRAVQMNEGADIAMRDVFLFLHADTLLPEYSFALRKILALKENHWGRFDISLSGRHPFFRVIEFFINLRSRITGIATGDQGLFIHKKIFLDTGGFPDIPLMEDVALSENLRRTNRPLCLSERVITSSRRWEQHGIIRTILVMWYLRSAWYLGVKPERLARIYAG